MFLQHAKAALTHFVRFTGEDYSQASVRLGSGIFCPGYMWHRLYEYQHVALKWLADLHSQVRGICFVKAFDWIDTSCLIDGRGHPSRRNGSGQGQWPIREDSIGSL